MGKIKSKVRKTSTYTTSDGGVFADQNALEDAKYHQTGLDLRAILEPKVREVFGFNPISLRAMEDGKDGKDVSDEDIEKAYDEEEAKIAELVSMFEDIGDFDEFFEAMVKLIRQYRKPIEQLILFSEEHKIGDHKIVEEK